MIKNRRAAYTEPFCEFFTKGCERMSTYDLPRLSIEISKELNERRRRLIPWGQEALLIRTLLSRALDLIEMAEEKGQIALGAILVGDITILDIINKKGKRE